mgnify:CR=1 FL=1
MFASIDNNPLVKFLAITGLSPSPLETIFGIKSLFSGMTEGLYQILHLNFNQAMKANIFSPIIIPFLLYLVIKNEVPKMNNRATEALFFCGFIILSIFVNIYN